ncbi:DoxX family protein [Actomonas aquatica]|uniref:DoxX family membrane protein n=1 Tax=Actomonas aquatica TaxID=2866162 RepID=A0ABZ1C2V0_9BACT|nr:DoxX family membrane protein [Opitutus sp. WL0086]WRQ85915.1 DoxX family membrane protein [Opitutus sp. WL0086]
MLDTSSHTTRPQAIARIVLGAFMTLAGVAHLTFQRGEFQAQVPPWVPLDTDFVVLASGVVEIALGLAMLILKRYRVWVGLSLAVFYVLIFPGNLSQYTNGIDAFGLDTDAKRFARLFFQPVLILWALWSTGGLAAWRQARQR